VQKSDLHGWREILSRGAFPRAFCWLHAEMSPTPFLIYREHLFIYPCDSFVLPHNLAAVEKERRSYVFLFAWGLHVTVQCRQARFQSWASGRNRTGTLWCHVLVN